MARIKHRKNRPHVRLYDFELNSEAYRSLSCEARALLVEFRALYKGGENAVFLSVREIRRRLGGVGQEKATRARDELLERGFIRLVSEASFHRKVRHAPEYCLTNETQPNGNKPSMEFMKWKKTRYSG